MLHTAAPFPDPAVSNEGDRREKTESVLASLLCADLEYPLCLIEDLDGLFPLVDRQGEGLFTVHVLAGPHRLNGDFRVPVVGRHDRHDVDIGPIEDATIIVVNAAVPMLL